MKKAPYVTVSRGLRGFYAVLVVWEEEGGFFEPFMTGNGSYATEKEAVPEAVAWARDERISFELQGYDDKGKPLS
jgi:hypothetical protein